MGLWIEDYLNAGERGKINIPKRVRKQYLQLIPILEGKDPRWYYNPKLASKPIDFGERFCRQSKDEWRGQPIQYLLWQKAALSAIYGIVERESDVRKHQRVFTLVGKKNGKTTMVAPVALYETARKGNEVYSAANALQQSRIIWQEAANMLDQSPQLQTMLKRRQYDIKNIRKNGFSVFMPLANTPNLLDGKLPKVVILDEVHELYQDLYDILYNGQISVRDPLFLMLTTKGYLREGLFDTEYKNSCDIIDGIIQDERKLSLLYELDNSNDWLNEDTWQQANPSIGTIMTYEALRNTVRTALDKPQSLNAVKVKHFNLGGVSGDAYFEYDTINNERTFDLKRFRGYDAIGGFDLSLTNDLTSFTTVFWDERQGEYCVDTMFWISSSFYSKVSQDVRMGNVWRAWVEQGYIRVAGVNSIDHKEIVKYVCSMVNKYHIRYRWIYYDAYAARYLVTDLHNEGFKEGECLIRAQQGSKTLSVPFQRLDAELRQKKVNYNNNPVMKWCLTNVAVEEDTRNKNLLPCKAGHNNMRKIDGFATLLNAFVGVTDHYNEFVGG
ncbi:MAG: terminase large subunit [Clostridia bacterium]|nr:terminase large subunit [Clostridia bacterium]